MTNVKQIKHERTVMEPDVLRMFLAAHADADQNGTEEIFTTAAPTIPAVTPWLGVRRVGDPQTPYSGRTVIRIGTHATNPTAVVLTAVDARKLAAALLNSADEIEGKTPLVFFPRDPEPEPAPE